MFASIFSFPHGAAGARRPFWAVGILAFAPACGSAWAGDSAIAAQSSRLRSLVREALDNNPSLQAARLQTESVRQGVASGRAWDAPQIELEFREIPLSSFPNPARRQTEMEYSLRQTLPFPGKRAARADVERYRAESEDKRAGRREREITLRVKVLYFELQGWDGLRRSNARNRLLLERVLNGVRKRYEAGLASQTDVLRAQTEWFSLASDSVSLEQARLAAVGRLNALLARPVDRPYDSLEAPVPESIPWTFAQLRPLAEAHRLELRELEAEARMRRAEKAAAYKEFQPDFMVRGAYTDAREAPSGTVPRDSWSVSLGFDLPIAPWSQPGYRAGYRRAGIDLARAGRERQAAVDAVGAEVNAALAGARDAWNRYGQNRYNLEPHAEHALRAALSAYGAGKSGFTDLLDAFRMAVAARRDRLSAAVKAMQGRAELEWAVGLDAEAIATKISQGGAP